MPSAPRLPGLPGSAARVGRISTVFTLAMHRGRRPKFRLWGRALIQTGTLGMLATTALDGLPCIGPNSFSTSAPPSCKSKSYEPPIASITAAAAGMGGSPGIDAPPCGLTELDLALGLGRVGCNPNVSDAQSNMMHPIVTMHGLEVVITCKILDVEKVHKGENRNKAEWRSIEHIRSGRLMPPSTPCINQRGRSWQNEVNSAYKLKQRPATGLHPRIISELCVTTDAHTPHRYTQYSLLACFSECVH